jgi:hypothetical protein
MPSLLKKNSTKNNKYIVNQKLRAYQFLRSFVRESEWFFCVCVLLIDWSIYLLLFFAKKDLTLSKIMLAIQKRDWAS